MAQWHHTTHCWEIGDGLPQFSRILVSNSLGFFLSLHMLYFLTAGFPLQIAIGTGSVTSCTYSNLWYFHDCNGTQHWDVRPFYYTFHSDANLNTTCNHCSEKSSQEAKSWFTVYQASKCLKKKLLMLHCVCFFLVIKSYGINQLMSYCVQVLSRIN